MDTATPTPDDLPSVTGMLAFDIANTGRPETGQIPRRPINVMVKAIHLMTLGQLDELDSWIATNRKVLREAKTHSQQRRLIVGYESRRGDEEAKGL